MMAFMARRLRLLPWYMRPVSAPTRPRMSRSYTAWPSVALEITLDSDFENIWLFVELYIKMNVCDPITGLLANRPTPLEPELCEYCSSAVREGMQFLSSKVTIGHYMDKSMEYGKSLAGETSQLCK